MGRVVEKSSRVSDRAVVVVLLAILGAGAFAVVSGYAAPTLLLGLLVLDGCVFALYAVFTGAVRADVTSFSAEIGATPPKSYWPRITHWLFVGITAVFTVDAILGGMTGRLTPLAGASIGSLGILLIIVFVLADSRAKIR